MPSLDKIPYSEFKMDQNKNQIAEYPDDKEPGFSIYHEDTEIYTARFSKEICEKYSLKKCCRVREIKDSYSIRFSRKQYEISKLRKNIDTEDYKKLTKQRAGIEGLLQYLEENTMLTIYLLGELYAQKSGSVLKLLH